MAPAQKKSSNNSDRKTYILKGNIYWAQLIEPNTTFEPSWQLDLCLTPETRKQIEAEGLNIRNKGDERGDFISLKHKVIRKGGERNDPPEVTDSQLNGWNPQTLIGNGSVANVKFDVFSYEYAGKAGRASDLKAVQIVKLVEYKRTGFDVVADGYVVDNRSHQSQQEDAIPF